MGAGILRSVPGWGGRGHRRAARRGRLAHVEVRGLDGSRAAIVRAEVERALRAAPGVTRAGVNGPLGRVVVELAGDEVELAAVVDVVAEVESALEVDGQGFPPDRPDHPADVAPIVREAVAAAASVAAIGAGAAGRLARLPRLPAEVGGLVAWVESQRHVRNAVESVAGPSLATAGLTLLNAALQAAAQGPVGPLADLGHRLSLVAEGRSRQAAWDRAQVELHAPGRQATGGDEAAPGDGDPGDRPVPLPDGPVETYGDQAAIASLAAAGGTFLATADLRRSAAAALATTPKAARYGRDAFAAHLEIGRAHV